MPRLSFSLRDVFWLTLVVGMGVGWWVQSQRSATAIKETTKALRDAERRADENEDKYKWLVMTGEKFGLFEAIDGKLRWISDNETVERYPTKYSPP